MTINSIPAVLAHSPMDWIAIGLLFSLFALDAFRVGASRAVAFSLAAPITVSLYEALPHTAFIAADMARIPTQFQGLFFLGLLIVMFLIVNVMTRASFSIGRNALHAILASLAATAIMLTTWQAVPSLVALWPFAPVIQHVFAPMYDFFWLLGAYLILVYVQL